MLPGYIAIWSGLFWIWVSRSLDVRILELPEHFRERKQTYRDYVGGPMYYIIERIEELEISCSSLFYWCTIVFEQVMLLRWIPLQQQLIQSSYYFNVISESSMTDWISSWNCDHAAGWYGTAGRYQADRSVSATISGPSGASFLDCFYSDQLLSNSRQKLRNYFHSCRMRLFEQTASFIPCSFNFFRFPAFLIGNYFIHRICLNISR